MPVLEPNQMGLSHIQIFQKVNLNAVLGIEALSKGMWWFPALRSKVVKYVAPFSLEKMYFTFGMGHVNFLVTLLRAL